MLRTAALAILLHACAALVSCSAVAEQDAPPANEAPSRDHVDGALLRTEDGGLIGVLDVQSDPDRTDLIRAELIMLQRQVVPAPTAATSQIHEIECPTGRDRILANIRYDRSGTPLRIYSVETSLSLRSYMRSVFDSLCRGDYRANAVARFDSLSGFLDLSDDFETRSQGSGSTYPPPQPVQAR